MRARHPFHSICPYFAMFPEQFVEQQLLTYTAPGDLVFDPFCGRGTTVFEGLLRGRRAAGSDVNRVAVCITLAKATAPPLANILARIDDLEQSHREAPCAGDPPTPFFSWCYDPSTLSEILFLRERLQWRQSREDCLIAAIMLGLLHGESHKSEYCLSNRMPRTISTKPEYSIRWWQERGLLPSRRPTFEILRKAAAFRFRLPPAALKGIVKESDARRVDVEFLELAGQVRLVVTSPPYLDTTDYAEDQWLRLWFLGGPSGPQLRQNRDDRHTRPDEYWNFLEEAWAGLNGLLAEQATIVIRIGGSKLSKQELLEGVTASLDAGLRRHRISPLHEGITSTIRRREVSAFRPTPRRESVEHDFAYRLEA